MGQVDSFVKGSTIKPEGHLIWLWELKNIASCLLLGPKSKGSCQNHEREWTLTWVTDMNGLSHRRATGLHQPFQLVLGDRPHCDHQRAAKASDVDARHCCLPRNQVKNVKNMNLAQIEALSTKSSRQ